jgi:hypothetical protein
LDEGVDGVIDLFALLFSRDGGVGIIGEGDLGNGFMVEVALYTFLYIWVSNFISINCAMLLKGSH